MLRLYGREVALILISGLFGALLVPSMLNQSPSPVFFWVGLLMGLTFSPLYALGVLSGRKMPVKVRNWMGVLLWLALFGSDFAATVSMMRSGIHFTIGPAYLMLGPGILGLLLPVLAALKAPVGERQGAALQMLFAYTFPMLGVLWVVGTMVRGVSILPEMARLGGSLYVALRALNQLYFPQMAEGAPGTPIIRRHPVPDRIVGLVERQTRHRALPFATNPDGTRDEGAIGVRCGEGEAESLAARIRELLSDQPFVVSVTERIQPETSEIVIRAKTV